MSGPPAPDASPSDTSAEATVPPVSLLSLPPEVLLDSILPILSTDDILSLSSTSKVLHSLCNDPSVWRTKTRQDFSYRATALATANNTSADWYKRVYLGLRRPRTYLWGSTGESRLGGPESVRAHTGMSVAIRQAVDTPMDVTDMFDANSNTRERTWRANLQQAPGTARYHDDAEPPAPVGIVDLQAGGWSFAARDMQGAIWVWGRLSGDGYGFNIPNWGNPHATVDEPSRIPLPAHAESMAVGRKHVLVLDSDNLVWEMQAWGKAYHHTAPELTAPSSTGAAAPGRAQHIVQIEAGWNVSACLMSSGDVVVWDPFCAEYKDSLTSDDDMHGPLGADGDDLTRIFYWGTVGADVVHRLEKIPLRPEPEDDEDQTAERAWEKAEGGMTDKQREDAQKVVKIACGEREVFALKGNGEVWVASISMPWQFLRHFSSPSITHISAQWINVFTYSAATDTSSVQVLIGRIDAYAPDTGRTATPRVLPGINDLPILQVVAGDWHYAALTTTGEMYTWGQNTYGQCGTGGGPEDGRILRHGGRNVDNPTRVTFPKDGDKDAFVFGITAAGMHSGALVLGHPRSEEEKARDKAARSAVPPPGAPPPYTDHDRGPVRGVPGFRFPGIFRIGLAGARGMRGMGSRGRGGPPGQEGPGEQT